MVVSSRPKEYADSLTLFEWLILLSKATGITLGLLCKAVRALLSGRSDGLSFQRYIAYEGTRDYQSGLTAVEIQNLLPSTYKICQKYAKKHSVQLSEIRLPDGTIALWLGPRKASRVVVLFHGGGYMSPARSAHISLAFGFSKPSQRYVAVVVLPYVLASENTNRYPRQLQQAVSLIEHLLYSEKLPPSAITLIGDSAGAHLLLSLVLHLSHPNPAVSTLKTEGSFAGVVLISPWVDMNSSAESITSNRRKDLLGAVALAYWAQNFFGDSPPDPWNTALMAPDEWWATVPAKEIVVTYGDDELLRDDAAMLCDKIKSCHPKATIRNFPGEVHVQMVMSRFLRINDVCESEKVFTKWMDDHLGS